MNKREYYKQYYLENIEKLRAYQKAYNTQYREACKGNYIYMICDKDDIKNIYYVGSTANVRNRISYHKTNKKGKIKKLKELGLGDSFSIYYIKLDDDMTKQDRKYLEQLYILDFEPLLNFKDAHNDICERKKHAELMSRIYNCKWKKI